MVLRSPPCRHTPTQRRIAPRRNPGCGNTQPLRIAAWHSARHFPREGLSGATSARPEAARQRTARRRIACIRPLSYARRAKAVKDSRASVLRRARAHGMGIPKPRPSASMARGGGPYCTVAQSISPRREEVRQIATSAATGQPSSAAAPPRTRAGDPRTTRARSGGRR